MVGSRVGDLAREGGPGEKEYWEAGGEKRLRVGNMHAEK